MVRGLMVLLMLGATVAKAQSTSTATGRTHLADVQESGAREVMLASRSTSPPHSSPLARSAGSPGTGTDAGIATKESTFFTNCSIVETLLGGTDLAIRTYQVPTPTPENAKEDAWKQAPYVAAVARCGQVYIFQVRSRSKNTWIIDRTRLEGPNGELLQVNSLRVNEGKGWDWDINVIVAEAPPGLKLSKLKLHLTGQDGRVAQPEAKDLPWESQLAGIR